MRIVRMLAPWAVTLALLALLVFMVRNDPQDDDAKDKCERVTNSVTFWASQPRDRAVLQNVCKQPEVRNRSCMPAVRVCEQYGFAGIKGPE